MAKQKEEIKFVVVQHYSGNKTLKDLLENLIMREITDTSKKIGLFKIEEKTTKRLKNQELRVIITVTNNSL